MRTCNTCGKSIDHKRADAKFCDERCKARRGVPRAAADAPTPAVFSGPPQTDPVFSDLGAALGGLAATTAAPAPVPLPTPSVGSGRRATPRAACEGDTDLVSASGAAVPTPPALHREARDPDGCIAADVADLHGRLDRGLARLDERPTKAEVAAMIKAALVPVNREIERVDRGSASTGATDALHEDIERIEVQLLGYPEERFDHRNCERPPVAAHAVPNRVVELEKAMWGWPATEPEDSARIEDGDPTHVMGRLELLDERTRGLRGDHDEVEASLTAYMLVINTVFSRRWGIELGPMVREQVARLKREARGKG